MIFLHLRLFCSNKFLTNDFSRLLSKICLLALIATLSSLLLFGTSPALASLKDDKYDGNIFTLYAGNGSLVPPRFTIAQSIERKAPSFLVFYLDDSSDCKQFSFTVSELQRYYGRAASFIPVSVDTLPVKSKFAPTEPGHYYKGVVPQAVILNQEGKVVFDRTGQVKFEDIDDAFRKVFDLLPRSESAELKRRTVNEFNAELTQ